MNKRATNHSHQISPDEFNARIFETLTKMNHEWIQSTQAVLHGCEQMRTEQVAAIKDIEQVLNEASVALDHCRNPTEYTQVSSQFSTSAFRQLSEHWQKMFGLMLSTGTKLSTIKLAPLIPE